MNWFLFGILLKILLLLIEGFIAAHTLPVLYEKYEDQVDSFVYNVFGQFQNQYQKLDAGWLSKIYPQRKSQREEEWIDWLGRSRIWSLWISFDDLNLVGTEQNMLLPFVK